jgi:ABC-type Fe3+-hydroxamate transport system substrate-binding protein
MYFPDQLDRSIQLTKFPPKRIVSLVPSQTELLYYLGLDQEVVGITKFCVHPEQWFRSKTRIGGTKHLHLDRIQALAPDLIIANKEENPKEQIKELMKDYPVWISDIQTLEDAFEMIRQVGRLTDRIPKAQHLVKELQQQFASLPPLPSTPQVAYFIWRNPYMVAANHTFIHEMIQAAGFQNAFQHKTRYPEISLEELKELDVDLIFLSSEPYPFKDKHFEEFKPFCQQAVIKIVDGELFSWYGSRLLYSVDYFKELRREFIK